MNKKWWSKRVDNYEYKNSFAYLNNIKNNDDLKILDFGIGEDNNLINEEDIKTLVSFIEHDKKVFGYSENYFPKLVESFQFYAYKHYGIYFSPENLLISNGIKESLNRLAYLLINKNDLVLVQTPGYNVFLRACEYYGAKIITLPLTKDNDFAPNIVKFCKNNKLYPKVIQINYPNNPTGKSVTYSYYAELASFVRSYGGIIINDAAYIDYTYMHQPISLLSQGMENLIELYSSSKSFGITGLRASMIGGDKRIIQELNKIRDQFDSGSSKLALFFYKYFLDKDEVNKNKEKYYYRYYKLSKVLKSLGFEVNNIDSTFFIYAKLPEDEEYSAKELAKSWRKEKSILVIPYDYENRYFRFSLTYDDENDPSLLLQRFNLK